jgi:hypothetical protein
MDFDDSVDYQQLGQSLRHLMSNGGGRLLERWAFTRPRNRTGGWQKIGPLKGLLP